MTSRPPPPLWLTVLLVALGGGAGSLARYGVSRIHPTTFPASTLIINVSGAFLLGLLVVLVDRWNAHPLVRPLLGTGVLGGYTTFSTFALESRGLAAAPAVGYVALTVVIGVLAAFGGMATGARLAGRPGTPSDDPDLP